MALRGQHVIHCHFYLTVAQMRHSPARWHAPAIIGRYSRDRALIERRLSFLLTLLPGCGVGHGRGAGNPCEMTVTADLHPYTLSLRRL